MNRIYLTSISTLVFMALSAVPGSLSAQGTHPADPSKGGVTMDHRGHKGAMDHSAMAPRNGAHQPRLGGQDAFAAIQEIVLLLESRKDADWGRYNLNALREHLIDMNAVTLNARATSRNLTNGLEVEITGAGRTLKAIQAMILPHSKELDGRNGWQAQAILIEGGARLTVTSKLPREVAHIQGLGFIGLMVTGTHHQAHHLAMAQGQRVHEMVH